MALKWRPVRGRNWCGVNGLSFYYSKFIYGFVSFDLNFETVNCKIIIVTHCCYYIVLGEERKRSCHNNNACRNCNWWLSWLVISLVGLALFGLNNPLHLPCRFFFLFVFLIFSNPLTTHGLVFSHNRRKLIKN